MVVVFGVVGVHGHLAAEVVEEEDKAEEGLLYFAPLKQKEGMFKGASSMYR